MLPTSTLFTNVGHYGKTCPKKGVVLQLQKTKRELHRLALCPKVNKQSPTILSLSNAALPLGPIAMPQTSQESSSVSTGFSTHNPPPPPQPPSVRNHPGASPNLIGAKITRDFGEKYGIFHGVVKSFDPKEKLYKIEFSDGDEQEMDFGELIQGISQHLKYTETGKL